MKKYSYNKNHKHTENGLVHEKLITFNTGFIFTISIGTGVDGESTCIIVRDTNRYPEDDSRDIRPKEYIIPIDDTNDLKKLQKTLKRALKKRKLTLIK